MIKKLFLKEVKEHNKLKKDFFQIVLSLFIFSILISVFVFIFIRLIKGFSIRGLKIELLTIFTSISLLLIIFMNLKTNLKIVFLDKENELLDSLPISKKDIIISKSIFIYLKELGAVFLFVSPFLIAYGIYEKSSLIYYILAVIGLLTFPFISIFFEMLLAFPYMKYKELSKKYFLVSFIFSLVFILLLFFGYKYLLDIIIGLVNDNRLQSVFSINTAKILKNICNFLIPVNFFGKILNYKYLYFLLYIILIFIFMIATYYLGIIFYNKKTNTSFVYKNRKKVNKSLSIKKTLYKKEIIEIIRDKDYLFSYISVIISLPLITYLNASIIKVFITKMFGENLVFAFLIFFLLLFSVLSNSIGSTILSKEKENIKTMKVIPISLKTQISVKRNLVIIIAVISNFLTMLILYLTNILNVDETIVAFVASTTLTSASILFSLSKDLLKAENDLNRITIRNLIITVLVGAFAIVLQVVIEKQAMVIVLLVEMALILLYALYKYTISFKEVNKI